MPRLQPRRDLPRNSPIAAVLLTNGDIDHALGLLLLREQDIPLVVYAADETRAALGWIEGVLAKFCGIEWRKTAPEFQTLSGSMAFRTIELPRSVAFQFRDDTSGATALFAPSVGELTDELQNTVHKSDAVLFDGTFWSDGELAAIRPGARSARQMNHRPSTSLGTTLSVSSLDVARDDPELVEGSKGRCAATCGPAAHSTSNAISTCRRAMADASTR